MSPETCWLLRQRWTLRQRKFNTTAGEPIAFLARYADADGVDDIWQTELRVANRYSTAPSCRLRYNLDANRFLVYDGERWLNAGAPEVGNAVAVEGCTLNAAASSVLEVDPNTIGRPFHDFAYAGA